MVQRLTRISSLMHQLKDLMPSFVLKTMYNAHVSSILSYCTIIWSGAAETTFKSLITIQKRIIRNITHSAYDAHTDPLFKTTKILKIRDIINLQIGLYFYKTNLHNLAEFQGNHNHFTRFRENVRPLIHRTTIFRRSFLFQSVALWDKLSTHHPNIVTANTITQFKNRLKTGLIQQNIQV